MTIETRNTVTTSWSKISDDEYFGDYDKYLTATQLKQFADCPWLADYHKRHPEAKGDTDALYFGRAVHCVTLEGKEEFFARFQIGGEPVNPRTGKPYGSDTQKFKDWVDSLDPDTEVISSQKAEDAIELAACVHNHDIAGQLLSKGEPEVCFRGTFEGIPVQAKIDWLGDTYIADLKTCQSLKQFESSWMRYRYDLQAAFYQRIVSPVKEVDVYFIAIEKQFPHLCAVYRMSESTLWAAQLQLDELLQEYKEATASQFFPTRTEAVRTL